MPRCACGTLVLLEGQQLSTDARAHHVVAGDLHSEVDGTDHPQEVGLAHCRGTEIECWHSIDAHGAAREVDPALCRDLGHEAERQRGHGQVEAARAQRDQADKATGQAGEQNPCQHAGRNRPAELGCQQGRAVGTDGVKAGLAKRHLPRQTEQHIEADHSDRRVEQGLCDMNVEGVADEQGKGKNGRRHGPIGGVPQPRTGKFVSGHRSWPH